ncbi:secretory carrier-associated membrane protein [Candidatus Gracilibacteria bacterium]|nr:secretory carrier-associated membrane protein [Candidatus Gracilibacteria bacterium]
MKTKKIAKEKILAWIVYTIFMSLFMIFFFGYLRMQDGSEMIDHEFRFLITYMLPIGLSSTISGIIAAISTKGKYIIIFLLGYIPAILFMLIMYTIIFFFSDNHSKNDVRDQYIVEQVQDTVITTKSGSEWKVSKEKDTYYHVVKHGESLEYIFNDINLSLQKAQEQGFDILKKDEQNKFEIIPIEKYGYELNQKTYLYSGLNPGDTVYLLKHELEKFRAEKHVSE